MIVRKILLLLELKAPRPREIVASACGREFLNPVEEVEALPRCDPKQMAGSPGWIRTSDHSINSRMLYR